MKTAQEWISILFFLVGIYLLGRAIHLHYGGHALLAYWGAALIFLGHNGITKE